MSTSVPPVLEPLCLALRDGLLAILGVKLHALYLFGAITFPEGAATGDIDFHAIVTAPLTPAENVARRALYAELAHRDPPLGADLDGYYLLLADARRKEPPAHQLNTAMRDESWALHRAHILAGRCFVLHGPDPHTIYPLPSWEELEANLWGELQYVEDHMAEYPAFAILQLCRLLYSFQTRDVVVSKRACARRALQRLPAWRPAIEEALLFYDRCPTMTVEQLAPLATAMYASISEQLRPLRPQPS